MVPLIKKTNINLNATMRIGVDYFTKKEIDEENVEYAWYDDSTVHDGLW